MLSKEEKDAIKLLKDIENDCWTTKYIMSSDSKNAKILLNLITKLQKENELAKEQLKKQCEIADERNDLLVKIQELQKQIDLMAEKIRKRGGLIMSNIEIGDYVRSRNGSIGKVTKIEDDKYLYENKELITFIGNVVKHSKNIIDLIEPGDFVNGNKVVDKYLYDGEKPVLETVGIEYNAYCLCEGDIREILTIEQYSQNCYTVERS